MIYESGFAERSRDEYAGHHLGADIGFAKTTTRKVLQHGVKVNGPLAVIWEETETAGTADGKPVRSLSTETTMLEKKGKGWVIMHLHWSSRDVK